MGESGRVTGGEGPYRPRGRGAKRRGIDLWPLQFVNVLRPCKESDSLSIRAPPRKEKIFSVFAFLSHLKRKKKTSEHSFNTTFSVCIPSLNPPAQKSQNQKKECLIKETQRGTAAKYTHEGSILVIYTITLWGRKELSKSFIGGEDDLQMSYVCVCDYLH